MDGRKAPGDVRLVNPRAALQENRARRIVGYALGRRIVARLTLAALATAIDSRHPHPDASLKLDGFCLISSDSDFTRLAQRLREDGLVVYGFGERKTPEAFRSACNRFFYVDNLIETGAEKESGTTPAAPAAAKKASPSKAVKVIAKAMEESDDDDGWANLGGIGSRILGTSPDFDPRTYGCPNLSTLATKSGGFELRKGPGTAVHIRRKVSGRGAPGKSRVGKTK